MLTTINENIRIWQEFDPIELSMDDNLFSTNDPKRNLAKFGFNKQRIAIKDCWFDVITPSDLIRKRNQGDGYYRVIYIQINLDNGEYYVGKANRPTWSQLKRYQGSGLKFASKYKKNKDQFVRFFIAICETAEETERLEASIVNEELLLDEKCLNLVCGGGGTTEHPSIAETSDKKREHMRSNPEQYKPMLEASKKAFQSGNTPALRARTSRIKETMSADHYRDMTRDRVKKWKEENPEEYAKARRKNAESIKSPESQAKRKASFDEWKKNNPEEYDAWQEKLIKSRTSEEAKNKRKATLKEWNENNPEQAQANAQKRAKAAAEKLSKEIYMIDLESGNILKVFPSQRAAAKWLVDNGKAKNMNCASSISAVCLRSPCTTGYGYRKKAYGYDWRFASEIKTND